MTETLSKDQVREALRRVKGPDLSGDIVSLGLVSDIVVSDGKVYFSISVPAERAREFEPLRQAAERRPFAPSPASPRRWCGADRRGRPGRRARGPAPAPQAACTDAGRVRMRATAPAACPASATSSRWRPARAASASRRPPSTWRWPEGERPQGRHPRRRHLRAVAAAPARSHRPAGEIAGDKLKPMEATASRSCRWASWSRRRRR